MAGNVTENRILKIKNINFDVWKPHLIMHGFRLLTHLNKCIQHDVFFHHMHCSKDWKRFALQRKICLKIEEWARAFIDVKSALLLAS